MRNLVTLTFLLLYLFAAPCAAAPESLNSINPVSSNPITIKSKVSDESLKATLDRLIPKYPGVEAAEVRVENGVVELSGHIDNSESRDQLTQVVNRVEGVRLVVNRMLTDQEVLSGWQILKKTLAGYWQALRHNWLLVLLAFMILVLTVALVAVLSKVWEFLLRPFIEREFVRKLTGGLINTVIVIAGLSLALSVLGLTKVVLSALGVAGVAGITLGFAFRDIGENLIASILLGVRRPFKRGDIIEIADKVGAVHSMNMRGTVLVTLDGKHVRIPNSIVFKEILTNRSASPFLGQELECNIPHSIEIHKAEQEILKAIQDYPNIRKEPGPEVLLSSFNMNRMRIKVKYEYPLLKIDPDNVRNDLLILVRGVLCQLGVFGNVVRQRAKIHRGRAAKKVMKEAASPKVPEAIKESRTEGETKADEGENLLAPQGKKAG